MTVPRGARRLIAAGVCLAVIDLFVPIVRDRLEAAAYEQSIDTPRFENSDFFGLGPLTQYLREHPASARPRTVFLGNSVLFGYRLNPEDSPPAAYQRLAADEKVFNASINGLDIGSSYLIAKAMIDSVNTFVVLGRDASHVHPLLPRLIPIDAGDRRKYAIENVDRSWLAGVASHWRLYRDTYRLQAAMFGTSTRQLLYLNKGRIVRDAIREIRGEARPVDVPVPASETVPPVRMWVPSTPAGSTPPVVHHPIVTDFGELFRAAGKRVILLQVRGYSEYVSEAEAAAFNGWYGPNAVIVIVDVPAEATFDGMHFTREGATAVARELYRVAGEGARP
jgi:hypothetical protein